MSINMKMPTVSIIQPWAGFILRGCKEVENRTWATKHRGPLLIHSSAKAMRIPQQYYEHAGLDPSGVNTLPEFECGVILGVVELVDCRLAQGRAPTFWHDVNPDPEFRNRYWWELADPVLFERPLRKAGQLHIWACELPPNIPLCHGKWKTLAEYISSHQSRSTG